MEEAAWGDAPKGLCSLGLLSLDLSEKSNFNASWAHGAPGADGRTFLTEQPGGWSRSFTQQAGSCWAAPPPADAGSSSCSCPRCQAGPASGSAAH